MLQDGENVARRRRQQHRQSNMHSTRRNAIQSCVLLRQCAAGVDGHFGCKHDERSVTVSS